MLFFVICIVSVVVWFLHRRTPIDREAEDVAEELILQVNCPYEDYLGEPLAQCQKLSIHHARAELGILKDTPANRLVVSELIRKFMRKPDPLGADEDPRRERTGLGMRNLHVSKNFTLAVEGYFVPTDEDIMAVRVRNTRAVRERKEKVETTQCK